ncbi:MAG TPA: DUF4838 domain-containing protein, partial [Armatimonadota bacterium]|nr:DUF4838 domain-containing protein [Armatimonadota bacterium]
MVVAERGASRYHLSLPAGAGPTERLAVDEIGRYVERMTGAKLPVVEEPGPTGAAIAVRARATEGEGFSIAARGSQITIEGDGPIGCLYGAYELLERLGCRWVFPGAQGEVVPRRSRLELRPFTASQEPSFPSRSIILGHPACFQDLDEWIVWCGRQRINNLFCHAGAPTDQQIEDLRRRGIALEVGGHGLPGLLPRNLFESHPQYFREADGQRVREHNFCPSNPDAREIVKESALEYFRHAPAAAFFHLWPDDLWEGGWCSCPQCAGLSSSDQALTATNVVAEALEEVWPEARLAYLAYHDTTEPPTKVRPHRNVFLENAPRERCYAHGLGDPRCERNSREYRPAWEALLGLFEADGRGNSHAFEYYSDTILFRTMQPPLLDVIPADARYYRDARTPAYQSLVVSTRAWHSPPFSLYLFARAAWDADADGERVLADYCRTYFGPEWEAARQYFRLLDRAFRSVLAFDVYVGPIPDLRAPKTEPARVGERKLREVERGRALVAEAGQVLSEAK